MNETTSNNSQRVNLPSDITKAERRLSGLCPECGDTGFVYIMFEQQISDYPYNSACECSAGGVWAYERIKGICK